MEEASRTIGARIREERKAAGLTQEQLAELAGTSTRTVRDIEKGTGATALGIVARVAEVVGDDPGDRRECRLFGPHRCRRQQDRNQCERGQHPPLLDAHPLPSPVEGGRYPGMSASSW